MSAKIYQKIESYQESTYYTKFINGIPLGIPNKTTQGNGFYISYNNYDISTYGDVTTALVTENPNHFYILNGDHREEYANKISEGFNACLQYFNDNRHLINKYSELP